MGKKSAGEISLISVANAKKGYITREKQSPFYLPFSLCLSLHVVTQPPRPPHPPFFNHSLSAHLFSLFMLHNGILRKPLPTPIPILLFHYSPFCPLLSPPPLPPPPSSRLACLLLSTSLYLITLRGPPCCDLGHR